MGKEITTIFRADFTIEDIRYKYIQHSDNDENNNDYKQ